MGRIRPIAATPLPRKLQADLDRVLKKQGGVAGGVEFVLTHADIPAADWQVAALWLDDRHWQRSDVLPFIWFPWYGDLNAWTAKKSKAASQEDDWHPECVINPGDRIWIEQVEFIDLANTTYLDVDRDLRMACGHLTVTRADGRTENIEKAVPIFRKHRVSATVRGTEFLGAFFRVQALHQASAAGTEQNPYADGAKALADGMLFDLQMSCERGRDPMGTLRLMSLGVSLGYLLAKAEQVAEVLPMAESGVQAKRAASQGGKASGARRRWKALPWEKEASAIAMAKAAECKSLSDLVRAITDELDGRKTEPPRETTLSNHVRRLQQQGLVPPFPGQRLRR